MVVQRCQDGPRWLLTRDQICTGSSPEEIDSWATKLEAATQWNAFSRESGERYSLLVKFGSGNLAVQADLLGPLSDVVVMPLSIQASFKLVDLWATPMVAKTRSSWTDN